MASSVDLFQWMLFQYGKAKPLNRWLWWVALSSSSASPDLPHKVTVCSPAPSSCPPSASLKKDYRCSQDQFDSIVDLDPHHDSALHSSIMQIVSARIVVRRRSTRTEHRLRRGRLKLVGGHGAGGRSFSGLRALAPSVPDLTRFLIVADDRCSRSANNDEAARSGEKADALEREVVVARGVPRPRRPSTPRRTTKTASVFAGAHRCRRESTLRRERSRPLFPSLRHL